MPCTTWPRCRISRSPAPALRQPTARAPNGNLATAVCRHGICHGRRRAGDSSRETRRRQFAGAVVGLGGFGVVTKLTLDFVPTFEVRQDVYENLPLSQLRSHFDAIDASAYSVSLFTDWRQEARSTRSGSSANVADGDSRCSRPPTFFGATRGHRPSPPHRRDLGGEPAPSRWAFPAPGTSACRTSAWTSRPAAARNCKPNTSCRASTPSRLSSALTELREQIAPLLHDLRGAHDRRRRSVDEPMLPAGLRGAALYLDKDWPRGPTAAAADRSALAPFGAAPALGQAVYHARPRRCRPRYAKLRRLPRIAALYDPQGKFRNAFLDRYIFGGE